MTDFDVSSAKVDDVKKYVEKNPKEAEAVLAAEKARGDDARSSLVKHLEEVLEGQADAPVAAEPKPVTVAPADQSAPNTKHTVLGVEYDVSAERGYRRS